MLIFGSCDSYLKKIERVFGVDITEHNGDVIISGAETAVRKADAVIDGLTELVKRNKGLTEQQVEDSYNRMMAEWINAPADWLDGVAPSSQSAGALIHSSIMRL